MTTFLEFYNCRCCSLSMTADRQKFLLWRWPAYGSCWPTRQTPSGDEIRNYCCQEAGVRTSRTFDSRGCQSSHKRQTRNWVQAPPPPVPLSPGGCCYWRGSGWIAAADINDCLICPIAGSNTWGAVNLAVDKISVLCWHFRGCCGAVDLAARPHCCCYCPNRSLLLHRISVIFFKHLTTLSVKSSPMSKETN